MRARRYRYILLSIVFLMLFLQSVEAQCDCASPNICRSFENADDVIVGTVKEVNTVKGYKISTFHIEKSFKGTLKDIIFLSQDLKVGDRYLLYPIKVGDYYQIFGCCSRDKTIENATADLKFLENLSSEKSEIQIFGTVISRYNKLPVKTTIYAFDGNTEYKSATDENGAYLFSDLPSGTYTIRTDLEKIAFRDWYRPPETKETSLELREESCIELNFISLEKK